MQCPKCKGELENLLCVESGVLQVCTYSKGGEYSDYDTEGGCDETWYVCPACRTELCRTELEADAFLAGTYSDKSAVQRFIEQACGKDT